MSEQRLLKHDWIDRLSDLIATARDHVIIVSPYITRYGVDFVTQRLTDNLKESGRLTLLTDMSPLAICQGSTDPAAVNTLALILSNLQISHLPKLHAKVYIADNHRAIVTSGNLTAGGLANNYEYGAEFTDPATVHQVREDVLDYAALGAEVSRESLKTYCATADTVREAFKRQISEIAEKTRREFESAFRSAEDQLVRIRLREGAAHSVFAKTILYLLKQRGPLTTAEMHPLIASIHPDICDNTIDRIIDGRHFGKKWKHAVRTAQQQLKKNQSIDLRDEKWFLVNKDSSPMVR